MSSPSRRPLIVTAVVLALVLPLLIAAGIFVRNLVTDSFAQRAQTQAARDLSSTLLDWQLDEETGIRGFNGTRETEFLEPYYEARSHFDGTAMQLATALQALRLPDAVAAIDDARAANAEWLRSVARPLLDRHTRHRRLVQRKGKQLVDRLRADIERVDSSLVDRDRIIDRNAGIAINRILLLVAGAVLLIGALAVAFVIMQSRLAQRLAAEERRSYDEQRRSAELRVAYLTEKRIADTLQEAFSQRPLPTVPMLSLSAMYVPATEDAKVGGDWYDALELSAERVLFAIGDVEGHGLGAAVGMNRARQSLITAALRETDAGAVLARVNAELVRDRSPMVTAVAGFADSRTYEFIYAIAGHPPPVLLEPGRAPRILDCGALPLGAMNGSHYETHRIQTVPGAMLVLYTDGAVEHSRDVLAGETLLIDAVARSVRETTLDPATAIHRAIFNGRPAGDDVAILTIGFESQRSSGLTISAEQGLSSFVSRIGSPPAAAAAAYYPHADGRRRRRRRPARNAPLADRWAS